jgi:hypothetical protein
MGTCSGCIGVSRLMANKPRNPILALYVNTMGQTRRSLQAFILEMHSTDARLPETNDALIGVIVRQLLSEAAAEAAALLLGRHYN